MPNELEKLLPSLIATVRAAGDAILPYFKQELDVTRKGDDTPLTKADMASHNLIVSELQKLSDLPILSEEGEIVSFEERQQWDRYWLVDPLDGTRGFISGVDEFTVNIALIDQHRPVLGVLFAPAYNHLYYACEGCGAFKSENNAEPKPIHVTTDRPFDSLRFIVGKYHKLRRIQPIIDHVPNAELLRVNSSLKFVTIAEGRADIYIRLGPISEWDTGAGHCILLEAGGKVVDFDGQSLQYNARKSLLCPPFIAGGESAHMNSLFDLFKREQQSEQTS